MGARVPAGGLDGLLRTTHRQRHGQFEPADAGHEDRHPQRRGGTEGSHRDDLLADERRPAHRRTQRRGTIHTGRQQQADGRPQDDLAHRRSKHQRDLRGHHQRLRQQHRREVLRHHNHRERRQRRLETDGRQRVHGHHDGGRRTADRQRLPHGRRSLHGEGRRHADGARKHCLESDSAVGSHALCRRHSRELTNPETHRRADRSQGRRSAVPHCI